MVNQRKPFSVSIGICLLGLFLILLNSCAATNCHCPHVSQNKAISNPKTRA